MSIAKLNVIVGVSGGDWGGKHRYMQALSEVLADLGCAVTIVADRAEQFDQLPNLEVLEIDWEADRAPRFMDAGDLYISSVRKDTALYCKWGLRPQVAFRHSGFPIAGDERVAYMSADSIVCPSMDLIRQHPFSEHPNVHLLRGWISQDVPRQRIASGSEPFRFGVVGRLSWEKEHEVVLGAFQEIVVSGEDVELVVAGEGPQMLALKEETRALGIEARVSFLGQVEDVWGLYAGLDALVFHSVARETGPLVVREAMWSGLPVIAADVGAVHESIEHGVTGLLYRTREELVAGMRSVLRNEVLRTELGARAYQAAHSLFGGKTVHADVMRIIGNGLAQSKQGFELLRQRVRPSEMALIEGDGGGLVFSKTNSCVRALIGDQWENVERWAQIGGPFPADRELLLDLVGIGACAF